MWFDTACVIRPHTFLVKVLLKSGGNYPKQFRVYAWLIFSYKVNNSHTYFLDEYFLRKISSCSNNNCKITLHIYFCVWQRKEALLYNPMVFFYSVCCQLNRIKMTHQSIIFWHLLHGLKIVRVLRNSIHMQHMLC